MTRSGIVATGALIALVVVAAFIGGRTSLTTVSELSLGDCFELPIENWDGTVRSVDVSDCSETLRTAGLPDSTTVAALVVHIEDLNPERDLAWAGEESTFEAANELCAEAVPEIAAVVPIAPDQELWSQGGRTVCLGLGR